MHEIQDNDTSSEKDGEQQTYKDVTHAFAENTNCNGIASIKRSRHFFRKFIWTLLVLAGAVLTIKQLVDIFTKFFAYPVSINVNVTFSTNLVFPVVTICNMNMVRKSMLPLINGTKALDVLSYTVGEDSNITSWATSKGRGELRHNFIEAWGSLNESTQGLIGHQMESMLLDCSYNGKYCDAGDFTIFTNPKYGNCYMFNSDWDDEYLHRSSQPGPFYGLMLELFIEQDEYIPELTESAGVIMEVHHQRVMPFPEEKGILVPPDQQSNIAITKETISRKEYPYPSDCLQLDMDEARSFSVYSDIYPVDYTHSACYRTCYQTHLFAECGCGDPIIPTKGYVLYNLMANKSAEVGICETNDEKTCEGMVHERYAKAELECNCSVACKDTLYEMTVTNVVWPNNAYMPLYYDHLATRNPHLAAVMDEYNATGAHPGQHLVKLLVYFNEFNSKEIEESAAYPRSSLLSDLGGSIGFYLGISVIAAFEFLEYFVDLCLVATRKNKNTSVRSLH